MVENDTIEQRFKTICFFHRRISAVSARARREGRTNITGRKSFTSCVSPFTPYAVYLHPAQDEELQPPQPEPEEDGDAPEPFPIPNFESRLVVSFELQEGQTTSGFCPKTSFSKQHWQALHWYSYMGMTARPFATETRRHRENPCC